MRQVCEASLEQFLGSGAPRAGEPSPGLDKAWDGIGAWLA